MNTFTAIDFETAQGKRWSICQVGIVRVINGAVSDTVSLLVQPPDNYYWQRFTDIHGIAPADTASAPSFEMIWPQIEPFISGQTVVAHNGLAFDFPALAATLQFYDLPVPVYDKRCTYQLYRDKLASLCEKYSISLNHHDALSDARACAELYLRWLRAE